MKVKREQICFLATALIEVRKSQSPVCVKSVGRCHHAVLEETWKQICCLSGPCEFLWKGWRRFVNIVFISLTLHLRSPETQPRAERSQITLQQRCMETMLKHNGMWAKYGNDHVILSTFWLCRVQKSSSKMLCSLPSALSQREMFGRHPCHVLLLWIGEKIAVHDAAVAPCDEQPCKRNMSHRATVWHVVLDQR